MSHTRLLDTSDSDRWNAFVDSSPQGSLYAKTWYLDALQVNYDIRVVEQGERIVAGIVLPRNEIGHTSNPMFVKYLGVLFDTAGLTRLKAQEFEFDMLQALVPEIAHLSTFDCTFHPNFSNWMPFYWAGFRQEIRYTFQIHQGPSHAELWSRIDTKARNAVRRAEREGLAIKSDVTPEQVLELVSKTFRRQGAPAPMNIPATATSLRRLQQAGHAYLALALNPSGIATAGCAIVYDANAAFLILNGIDDDACGPGDNLFLLWHCIRQALETSRIFDFEGSMMQPIARVYRRLGGELTPFHNIWQPSMRTTAKRWAIPVYKKLRYGR